MYSSNLFPQSNPFYPFGESYAGKFVPSLTRHIHERNQEDDDKIKCVKIIFCQKNVAKECVYFFVTRMFALLGSTWWEWELETGGCPRTTTPATQTNSIRWGLDFTKVRQLWKPCYRALPKCYRWDLWTKTIATTALLKNKTPNITLMPEACECGNTPNSVDLLFLLRGKNWLKLFMFKIT